MNPFSDWRAIYKYPLRIVDVQDITMPARSRVLTVQFQDTTLCVWAMTTPGNTPEARRIWIVGTGHAIPPDVTLVHLGTVQRGALVWHLFEEMLRVDTGSA